MGLILNRGNERLDALEEQVEDLEDDLREAEAQQAKLRGRISNLTTLVRTTQEMVDIPELEDKEDVVETLDEPRIAWKGTRDQIVKLLIPEGASVVHPKQTHGSNAHHKKRVDKAIALMMFDASVRNVPQRTTDPYVAEPCTETVVEESDSTIATSKHDNTFHYRVGERVEPDRFRTSTEIECTNGIHVFCTQDEATEWYRYMQ